MIIIVVRKRPIFNDYDNHAFTKIKFLLLWV